MRGYISFLLVFAALAIFLISSEIHNSSQVSLSKPLAIERTEQVALDAKRTIMSAAKYGAIAGFSEYLAECIPQTIARINTCNLNEAKNRTQIAAYLAMASVPAQYEDYEIERWCAEINDENELKQIASDSLNSNRLINFGNSLSDPASLALCPKYMQIDGIIFDPASNSGLFAGLYLGSANYGAKPKIFGITIYSKKFGISKIAYVPTSENLIKAPYSAVIS